MIQKKSNGSMQMNAAIETVAINVSVGRPSKGGYTEPVVVIDRGRRRII